MTRRESRICTFELLFETDFHKNVPFDTIIKNALEIREATVSEFAALLYRVCTENLKEIDEKTEEAAENWKVSRMNRVTRSVLRLAVGEMLYTDTPPKVAVNEAVEIAKLYGDDKSPAFVNGILNRLAHSEGKINEVKE